MIEGDDGTFHSRLRAPPWRVARGREEGHRHRADHTAETARLIRITPTRSGPKRHCNPARRQRWSQRSAREGARLLPERATQGPSPAPSVVDGGFAALAGAHRSTRCLRPTQQPGTGPEKELVDRAQAVATCSNLRASARRVVEPGLRVSRADGGHAQRRSAPDARGPGSRRARAPAGIGRMRPRVD